MNCSPETRVVTAGQRVLEVVFAVVISFVAAFSNATSAIAQTSGMTAFVNVNVVPMDAPRVLPNHTVIVEGDRITAIGPSDTLPVPDGAEVVNGDGGYLMPGLADMHVHLEMRDPHPQSLVLYLAEGTTTVRSMSGDTPNLDWRARVEAGELTGPTILTAGPILIGTYDDMLGYKSTIRLYRIAVFVLPLLAGSILVLVFYGLAKFLRRRMDWLSRGRTYLVGVPLLLLAGVALHMTKTPPFHLILPVIDGRPAIVPENTAQVIAEVRRIHAGGYDFVKPYDDLTEEQYLGAIAEAKRLGMYVAGHALDQISLEAVMTSGIDEIVHLDELNFHHWKGKPGEAEFEMDYAAIPETAALMTANGVNIVSNLSLDEALIEIIYDTEATLARPEYWVVRPETKAYWRNSGRQLRQFADQGPYRRDIEIPFFLVLVKALHDAGVIVTTGTDTAEFTEGSLPSHIHRELELLVEAGLSNFEALSAGTRNAAEIVRRMDCDGSFGTIEVGQRADLLLLRENPLDDVSRTRERIGVTVRGRWYPQSKLDEMVAAFVDIY